MSASVHICQPADLDRLHGLRMRRLEEAGIDADPELVRASLLPLAEGGPAGAAYLLGPVRSPVGYGLITFYWSLTDAGYAARIEDLYIRPSVRRRGMGTDAIMAIARGLRAGGIHELTTSFTETDGFANIVQRAGFIERPQAFHFRTTL